MNFCRYVAAFVFALTIFVLPNSGMASNTIAHRGLYHDVISGNEIAENSYQAVVRAYDLGANGVELDLRLSSDGDLIVTHDLISNRATDKDNAGGNYDSVNGGYFRNQSVTPIYINSQPASYWMGSRLKSYPRGSGVTYRGNNIQDLGSMLANLKSMRRDIYTSTNFKIILDIQDPTVLSKAAGTVRNAGGGGNVYLKFFVTKAIFDNLSYDGSNSCYVYARNNNLTYLNIIPQINDGELDINEDDNAGINKWGHRFSIPEYLQCWADAQSQHADAAVMRIVSASVPVDNIGATAAAVQALNWARQHGRATMTIVPNPDAGFYYGGVCHPLSFQSTDPKAKDFNMSARNAKANFASSQNPDYIIWDLMGNVAGHSFDASINGYLGNLCN